MSAQSWWPYLWGALGGIGILLVFYGLRRVMDKTLPHAYRRAGLWLVNAGVLSLAASMALAIWVK
jgi:hypothetical protein